MTWLHKIVPSIGLLIGIVFVAIGATMGVSSSLKLALYEPVYSPCAYPYAIPDEPRMEKPISPEESCENQKKSERAYYIQSKKENIIDGGVFLLVGIVFWLIFRKAKFQN